MNIIIWGAGKVGFSISKQLSAQGHSVTVIDQSSEDIKNDNLYTYNWPGNVRELRNLVERVTILSADESKQNIDKLMNDILGSSSSIENEQLSLIHIWRCRRRG